MSLPTRTRAAVRRQHARGGTREPQREFDRHRVRPDAPADAVRTEVPHRSGGFVPHAEADRADDPERVDGRGHVVRPDDARTVQDAMIASRQAAGEPVAVGAARELHRSALARQADEHRAARRLRAAAAARSSARLCSRVLPKPKSGIDEEPRAWQCRPHRKAAARSRRKARTSADDVVVMRLVLHRSAARPACASGRPRHRYPRPPRARPGAPAPCTSLIDRCARPRSRRRITSGLLVSTETGTARRPTRRSITGITRRSSSSASTGQRPAASTRRRRRRSRRPLRPVLSASRDRCLQVRETARHRRRNPA